MASIGRYRPPREGYQPPTLAAAPRQDKDRASHSPARRREVPPAVPTPPQNSSRPSPPRSARAQPARAPSTERTPLAAQGQWGFTSQEVHSTPSVVDGLLPSEERLQRAKGVNFIYQAGVMLDLPQITLWVAGLFFHRFYMRWSMVGEKGGIHHYVRRPRDVVGHWLTECRISPPPHYSSPTRSRRTAERQGISS